MSLNVWEQLELENVGSLNMRTFSDGSCGLIYVIRPESIASLKDIIQETYGSDDLDNSQLALAPSLDPDNFPPGSVNEFRTVDGVATIRRTTTKRSSDTNLESPSIDPLIFKFINQSLLRYLLRNLSLNPSSGSSVEATYGISTSTSNTELHPLAGTAVPEDENATNYASMRSDIGRRQTSVMRRRESVSRRQNSTIRTRKLQEYRQVSIVFVKIKPKGRQVSMEASQNVMLSFLEAVEAENGCFQQMSDKKEQPAALRACRRFLQNAFYSSESYFKHEYSLKIAVASGSILFSEIGNVYRKDASILGDIVNIAARMISVEGASGLGKSTLVKHFLETCSANEFATCFAQGSEVDQWTPYFGIRTVILAAYSIYAKEKESKAFMPVPQKKLARTGSILSANSTINSLQRSRRTVSRSTLGMNGGKAKVSVEDSVDCRAFLAFCGEDPQLAPLLADVSPQLTVSENSFTSKLDGKARASIIKSMVVRMVNYLTQDKRRIAWLDPSSLEILNSLVEGSPKLLILISSRPVPDTAHESIRKLLASEKAKKIVLEGLGMEETEELLVNRLRRHNVTAMDPKLLSAIFEKTRGSPLFADFIASSLDDAVGDSLAVTMDGVLTTVAEDVDIESVILADVGSGIRSQFDSRDLIPIWVGEEDAKKIQSPARQAYWSSMIAFGSCQRRLFHEAKKVALESLTLMNVHIPQGPKETAKAVKKALFRQIVLYFKTKAGTRLLPTRPKHQKREGENGNAAEVQAEVQRYAEVRGDAVTRLIVLASDSVVRCLRGDFEYGYACMYAICHHAAKIDVVWAGNAPLRVTIYYILVGNLQEASVYSQIMLNYLYAITDISNFVQIAQCCIIWLWSAERSLENSKARQWMSYFEEIFNTWVSFDKPHIPVVEAMIHASYAICLTLIPWLDRGAGGIGGRGLVSMLESWDFTLRERFTATLRRFEVLSKKMWRKQNILCMIFPWTITRLAINLAEKGRTDGSLKALERAMASNFKGVAGKVLKDMMIARAYAHWLLGTFLAPSKRGQHIAKANEIFTNLKASGMLRLMEESKAASAPA
ncbi:hypothetical protein HDU96_008296 [Phlyctochytrium bullatum]|nr:hypothetical protein HDU96_008296 [Phlyctochytrium bullatum]